jgi:hypothetical protein
MLTSAHVRRGARVILTAVWTAAALLIAAQSAPPAYTPPPSVDIRPGPNGTYKVTFKYQSAAQKVYLSGPFNDWATNKDEMQRYGNLFYITVDLPEGVHEYKFVEEGTEWVLDPLNMDRIDNGLGSKNNVLRLGRNIPAPTPLPPSLTQAAIPKSTGTLEWLTSIPAAQQRAAKENKRILLFFFMRGSKTSDLFDQLFESPEVAPLLKEKYVLVRLNFMEQNKLAYQLGVFRAGVINIYDSKGQPVKQITQKVSPTELAEMLK